MKITNFVKYPQRTTSKYIENRGISIAYNDISSRRYALCLDNVSDGTAAYLYMSKSDLEQLANQIESALSRTDWLNTPQ
jgi:hypothetical protein